MLAAVEARVPFLDHELVKYVYREIPYDLKSKWKSQNLREMASQYLNDSAWFRSEKLQDFLADCNKEKIRNQILWMFLNIEIFYQSYFTNEWRY